MHVDVDTEGNVT